MGLIWGEIMEKKKVTIEELERIMEEKGSCSIHLNADGSITATKDLKILPDVVRLSLKESKELKRIEEELYSQYMKWGLQPRTLFEWLTYLTEEVGELAEAISENHYRGADKEEILKEATQVAALAIKILQIVA